MRVRIWDQMVLVGLGLALFYTVFESILFIFLQVDVDVMQRIFGPGMSAVYGRATILCLFVIFGAHAQYTINQRKQAETALRESEERFRLIVETAPVGYFELDLEGGFTFFNEAALDILGVAPADMAARNQIEFVDRASREKLEAAYADVLATGSPARSIEWLLARRDGSKRFAESSISLLRDRRGRSAGFSVFMRDITERRRSEALRRAKLAAEAASRSKGEFLASMSHEIRTPLNAVIGLVDLMLTSDLRPDQREDLDVVRSSAYALLSIINNVLDYSKIEAGRLELDRTSFSLELFLEECLKIVAMKAHSKRVELACRMAPGVPDRLVGDMTRLRQVLLNLVDNAIKFTERGEVIVSVRTESQTHEQVLLRILVTDTGVGIAPEKQRRIFKAYDQGDPSVSRRYGGTGLGLAVSAQLVKLMGGRIGVRSRPGQGSTFGFTAAFARQGPEASPAAPSAVLAGRPVLVVDDSPAARRIVAEILERAGMTVAAADGAQQARARLARAGPLPAVVLVDSDMPGTDGFGVAAELRRDFPAAQVVMMLTFPQLKRKAECAALGVSATLVKPFGQRSLLDAVERVLAGSGRAAAAGAQTPAAAAPDRRPLKILVVEDTAFNQKFILRLLERWGHTPVLAEDGSRAVELYSGANFDLILMDLQMPEMDGFQAARAIRMIEDARGGHTPIIALSAHAIHDERERCLESGMDEYLPKPVDSDALRRMIDGLIPPGAAARPAGAVQGAAVSGLLMSLGNDWGFVKEVVDVFCADYPHLLSALRSAAASSDAPAFMRAAHSLKGMLRNFQAEPAAAKAQMLEQMGLAGDLAGARPIIAELAEGLSSLEQHLRSLLARAPAAT
ncbi:MAG: response regulator [Desulfobacterales bacterium]|nr:response regulator [Desulfobacterales bacterium]